VIRHAGTRTPSRWAAFVAPIRRYLAAGGLASWLAYRGHGLRTVLEGLRTSLAVLRVEAVRQCRSASRALDHDLLLEALRASGLLLVHLASPQDLADRLSALEAPSDRSAREV
jgi:hypothetical protein